MTTYSNWAIDTIDGYRAVRYTQHWPENEPDPGDEPMDVPSLFVFAPCPAVRGETMSGRCCHCEGVQMLNACWGWWDVWDAPPLPRRDAEPVDAEEIVAIAPESVHGWVTTAKAGADE